MCGATVTACICWVALRKESVDRNRTPHHRNTRPIPSLSARRAWIEILTDDISTGGKIKVALRKESVDRNFNAVQIVIVIMVALRKESVDRNSTTRIGKKVENVALRKESVDRNL